MLYTLCQLIDMEVVYAVNKSYHTNYFLTSGNLVKYDERFVTIIQSFADGKGKVETHRVMHDFNIDDAVFTVIKL